ncbi:MAG: hypothetical protein ACOX5R_10815 [bacterium]|jgi:hypothetical protein
MTAEIVIMNKSAVAIAADSAVTFRHSEGQKIFVSANKIFTLSKYHPVGVMIYGNASFMGVPWETLIKTFREEQGNTESDYLCEYAKKFLQYLHENISFFEKGVQNLFW